MEPEARVRELESRVYLLTVERDRLRTALANLLDELEWAPSPWLDVRLAEAEELVGDA